MLSNYISLLLFVLSVEGSKNKSPEEKEVLYQLAEVNNQMETIMIKLETLEEIVGQNTADIAVIRERSVLTSHNNVQPVPEKYQFGTFGCVSAYISLACTDGKKIYVYSAEYGKYYTPCNTACCSPHPGMDCKMDVEQSSPQDWIALKYLCDNQTTCEFQYTGYSIDNCEPGYMADYMSIYYTCLPETEHEVAFLACIQDGEEREYGEFEVIVFDRLETDFGGHFDLGTSIFICPVNGMYLFSQNIMNAVGKAMHSRIMIENALTVRATAHADSESRRHSSNLAIAYCAKGDRVYMDSEHGGTLYGQNCRSNFAGYLLHAFD